MYRTVLLCSHFIQSWYEILTQSNKKESYFTICFPGYSEPHETDQVEELLQDVNRVKYHKAYLAALASAIR